MASPAPPPPPAEEHRIALKGQGRVEVAAYGLADAEHLVEKDLGRLWPEAHLRITEIVRAGEENRIAEEFRVAYRLECTLTLAAPTREAARREAFRRARERLAGSRYWRTEWEAAEGGKDRERG